LHNGIKVEQAYYNEHLYDDKLLISNGFIVEGLGNRATLPNVSESVALETALEFLQCDTFFWEDDSLEYYLKLDSIDGDTTYYPIGELLFTKLDSPYYSLDPIHWKLAWVFEIRSKVPYANYLVYIDANNGEVIKFRRNEVNSTFNSPIYGNSLYLDTYEINGSHYLWGNDGGKCIKTKRAHIGNGWNKNSLRSDNDGDFASDFPLETQTHFVVNNAYSYWNERHKRAGLNGKNKELRVTIFNAADNVQTAFYNHRFRPDEIAFGAAPNNALEAVIDVAGHEYAHGIIHYTSELDGVNIPGAIGEGLADIFGVCTEAFANGGTYNWTLGEDATWITRDLETPSNNGNPREVNGLLFFNATGCTPTLVNDACGIHTNCGVMGRWFFLLTEGGSNIGFGCFPVNGISLEKAEAIIHLATIKFIGTNTNFAGMRAATIRATQILFGMCSYEEVQVCRAWANCNVGGCCECIGTASIPNCWPDLLEEGKPFAGNSSLLTNAKAVKIFPNPVDEKLNLNFNFNFKNGEDFENSTRIFNYEIYNIQGVKVQLGSLKLDDNKNIYSLEMNSLPSGFYILTLDLFGVVYNYKFIKK